MAHFAQLNTSNIVQQVIVVNNSDILHSDGNESEAIGISFCQALFGTNTIWRQTSYNGTFRCNYAGIGFHYDTNLDAFIKPQPFPSWTLNPTSCQWEAPVPYPEDGVFYIWNEETISWVPN